MDTQEIPSPGHPGVDDTEWPSISVVVPVRNEAEFLPRTLDRLLAQEYPADRLEILIVDGESDDATFSICEQYSERHDHVKCYRNPRRWSSAARNIGVKAASGEIILVVDGHCQIPDNQLLAHLAAAFEDPSVACVGRPQPLDVQDATPLQLAIAAARSSWLGHHPDSFIYADKQQRVPAHSVAVAYRREVFDEVGFFDEQFDACEDVELNHRIDQSQLPCLLEPKVAIHYHPRKSLTGLFRQLVRYGRGRIRLLRKHSDTFSWKTLIPLLLVLYILAFPLMIWTPAPWNALYLSGLAIYLLTVIGTSIACAIRDRRLSHMVWLPWVFLVIHTASGWGLLRETVLPRKRATAPH